MKKLSYIILGILIGALATYYFSPKPLEEVEGIETNMAASIKPKGIISVKKAKELNKNWTEFRKPAVDSCVAMQTRNHKKEDARSAWWSIREIKEYLAFSKKEAKKLGYNMTGLRVYLGVYGKNEGQDKDDLATMFMVPTGVKQVSKGSSLNLFLPPTDSDIPAPPLNRGGGGTGGYPQ